MVRGTRLEACGFEFLVSLAAHRTPRAKPSSRVLRTMACKAHAAHNNKKSAQWHYYYLILNFKNPQSATRNPQSPEG
jgi:hypothetical protein